MNAGPPILETDRLIFRPFTPDDFDLLADLHSDPQVQRYLGGAWSRDIIQERLDFYVGEQARLGRSKWKALLRDGTFVGRAGVSTLPQFDAPELGYSFKRAAWGKGLATEAARAVAAWMFANTDAQSLIGFAHVDNLGSRRVLEKIGMTVEAERPLDGQPHAFYRLKRPAAA